MRLDKYTLLIVSVGSLVAAGAMLSWARGSNVNPIGRTSTTATTATPPIQAAKPPLAPARTAPATSPSVPQVGRILGVENFAQVSTALYRGAQPTPDGFAELKKLGVRTIVNLRAQSSDQEDLRGLGLRYVHLRCQNAQPDIDEVLSFLKVMDEPENRPVFVHCQQGADRTGHMVAAYRIACQGWATDRAVDELRAFGYSAPWPLVSGYLKRLDPRALSSKLPTATAPRPTVVD